MTEADISALTSQYSRLKPGRVFGIPLDSDVPIPPIIRESITFLNHIGPKRKGIYRVSGNTKAINKLIGAFTKGKTVKFEPSSIDPFALASVLKVWFRMLPDPLITYQAYMPCIIAVGKPFHRPPPPPSSPPNIHQSHHRGPTASPSSSAPPFTTFHATTHPTPHPTLPPRAPDEPNWFAKLRQIRAALLQEPEGNRLLLQLLMDHLFRISVSKRTQITAHNLSVVFGPSLVRPPVEATELRLLAKQQGKANTVIQLLMSSLTLYSGASTRRPRTQS